MPAEARRPKRGVLSARAPCIRSFTFYMQFIIFRYRVNIVIKCISLSLGFKWMTYNAYKKYRGNLRFLYVCIEAGVLKEFKLSRLS